MKPNALDVRGAVARADTVDWLGRLGLASRGVLYALLAVLALDLALDRHTSHQPDSEGALQLVADQPLGELLVVLLAVGFAGHSVWRLSQAIADRERAGRDPSGLAERTGYLAIGLLYAALAVVTLLVALGGGKRPGGVAAGNEQDTAQGVFGWPLGRALVFAAGLGFVAAALGTAFYVLSGKLRNHLSEGPLSRPGRELAVGVGVGGYFARALVFAMIGVFLCKAAWEHDPGETRGLDGALLELVQAPHGPIVLSVVAVGLLAFGAWSLVESRYRDV
jgi:hypothetical protein